MAESRVSTTIFNPLVKMVVSQQHPKLYFLNGWAWNLSSVHAILRALVSIGAATLPFISTKDKASQIVRGGTMDFS